MPEITYDNAQEFEPHKFSAEASDLRWAPGHWPRVISTCIGNGQPFVILDITDDGATYRQMLGCVTLRVFND